MVCPIVKILEKEKQTNKQKKLLHERFDPSNSGEGGKKKKKKEEEECKKNKK